MYQATQLGHPHHGFARIESSVTIDVYTYASHRGAGRDRTAEAPPLPSPGTDGYDGNRSDRPGVFALIDGFRSSTHRSAGREGSERLPTMTCRSFQPRSPFPFSEPFAVRSRVGSFPCPRRRSMKWNSKHGGFPRRFRVTTHCVVRDLEAVESRIEASKPQAWPPPTSTRQP